jgi:transcriptional regulator with XRE-family HTH domain
VDDSPVELERLGALVESLRLAAGLSGRALARRAAVAPSTVCRLERGLLRPRPSLLMAIGNALDPDRQREIRAELTAAAGPSMAEDTRGWVRRRRRAIERGWLTGDVPLPSRIDRAIRLHNASAQAWRAGMAALDKADAMGCRNNLSAAEVEEVARLLAESDRMFGQARELAAEAGPPVSLMVGGRIYSFGLA